MIKHTDEFKREAVRIALSSGLPRDRVASEQQEAVRNRRAHGASLGVLAKEFGVSRSAIQRSALVS